MNVTLSLIKDIRDRQSLYQAKERINQVATVENKEILMKALRDKIFEIRHEVTLQ